MNAEKLITINLEIAANLNEVLVDIIVEAKL